MQNDTKLPVRDCVQDVALASGIPVEYLTTMADIYSGLFGLPDEAPYNETVTLVPGIRPNDPIFFQWEVYLLETIYPHNNDVQVGRPST